MFARHTRTRMKGSGVVQGLKSLASKLHPQLPLSAKESQRLLTALTSSFRQQLDAAHPRGNGDARPSQERRGPMNTGTHGLHSSSAAFADKHLASVLTSPLLSHPNEARKPVLDCATVKVELHKNPGKDPISLLEEYHEKGVADVPVATLCLKAFQDSLENLSPENRRKELLRTEAGKRTLLWLWKSKLHETDAFVDDKRFMDLMIPLVIEEGFEDYLWDWLKLDVQLGSQGNLDKFKGDFKKQMYKYRWKGYIVRRIVSTKLLRDSQSSVDSALDAFFKACDLRKELDGRDATRPPLPLAPARTLLETTLSKLPRSRHAVDPARYDRFIECLELYGPNKVVTKLQQSFLHLYHPRSPSPLPLLTFLRKLFSSDTPVQELKACGDLTMPTNEKRELHMFYTLIDLVAQLQDCARKEDADWVLARIHQLYPKRIGWIPDYLRRARKELPTSAPTNDRAPASHKPIPFPTFV